MTTLLEQVEALDFEVREKIVVALKKRPEKAKEEILLEEIKLLRNDFVKAEKKLDKKVETVIFLFISLACLMLFLMPMSSSKSSLRLI